MDGCKLTHPRGEYFLDNGRDSGRHEWEVEFSNLADEGW